MSKKLAYNVVLLLLLNGLIKPLYLVFVDLGFLKELGNEEYGVFFTLWNIATMLNVLLDVGISYFNTHNISQNEQLLNKHFSALVSLRIILAVFYILILVIVSLMLGHKQFLNYILIIGFNQVVLSFTLFLRSNLSALQQFKKDSFISVVDKLLLLIFGSLILYVSTLKITLWLFIAMNTFAYLLTAIYAFVLVNSEIKVFKLRFNKLFFMAIVKKSVPYASLVLLMSVYYRLDTIMISYQLTDGYEMSGVYAQGYRLYEAVSIYGYIFGALLLPMFSKMLKNKEEVYNLLSFSFRIALGGGILIAGSLIIFKDDIFQLLFNKVDLRGVVVYVFLMLGFVSLCSTYIFGTLITATKHLKWMLKISGLAILINFSLNFLLIKKMGVSGAAFASFLTQTVVAILQIVKTKKILLISPHQMISLFSKFLLQMILSIVVVLYAFCNNLSFLTLLFLCFLLIFIFMISGMLPIKEVKKYLVKN